jgi:ABC-type glycerol-3-phosphate transport system substrate-binding protein
MSQGKPTQFLVSRQNTQTTPDQDVVSALRFFMDFSSPLKDIYTWSRALPNSRDQFINGNLAVYFDYASAYGELKAKNPHLNFEVAPVPQPRGTKVEITFAHLHGLAVMKSSRNKATAFIAVQRLLGPEFSGGFASAFNLPPVRRDLLAVKPTDKVLSVLYDAAIRARTWLDPRPEDSDKAFQQTVESVSSGRNAVPEAIGYLSQQLFSALQSI